MKDLKCLKILDIFWDILGTFGDDVIPVKTVFLWRFVGDTGKGVFVKVCVHLHVVQHGLC